MTIKSKRKIIKIIHLSSNSSDYTLCGFGSECVNDESGVCDEDAGHETYESMIATRKKYNTNCRQCQNEVESILRQIRTHKK